MSGTAVTHFLPDGTNDTTPIEIWIQESAQYAAISKLKFFRLYLYWKNFYVWKRFLQKRKFKAIFFIISSLSCYTNNNFF
jgi:hypothetical protein